MPKATVAALLVHNSATIQVQVKTLLIIASIHLVWWAHLDSNQAPTGYEPAGALRKYTARASRCLRGVRDYIPAETIREELPRHRKARGASPRVSHARPIPRELVGRRSRPESSAAHQDRIRPPWGMVQGRL